MSDPTFVAMLKTPECREIWEKVLEMRWGFNGRVGADGVTVEWADADSGFCYIDNNAPEAFGIDAPRLGELWAIAIHEPYRLRSLTVDQRPEALIWAGGPRLQLYVDWYVAGVSAEPALVAYIVGRPWNAAKGVWKA